MVHVIYIIVHYENDTRRIRIILAQQNAYAKWRI